MGVEKIKGIVIDVIKHNDRHNIIRLFTRTRGVMNFLSPVSSGKAGRMRNARLQILSVIETEVNIQGNKTFHHLGSVSVAAVRSDLYFNPVKSAVGMFIAEFLQRYLREAAPEPYLWDFVDRSLEVLDKRQQGISNFHISFLVRFLQFAGITPDISDLDDGDYFDMLAGKAVAEHPLHKNFLYPSESKYLKKILRINFENDSRFNFKAGERRMILEKLLQYYAVHFPGMNSLRTPEILTEVFN